VSVRIPEEVRLGLRQKLWGVADGLDWGRLSLTEKTSQYEAWTRDAAVGGQLGHYMDQRQVRVYIKDTIMKGYRRSRLAAPDDAMRVLGFEARGASAVPDIVQDYERPHGRRLKDGRVIAWGEAKDWKAILMSLHERAFEAKNARPYAAVLFLSAGKFEEDRVRALVQDAATKLGVEKLVWRA
jgi:hypothetical protein